MERAREVLRESFGHQEFRRSQAEIIEATLDGRDSLVLMPTGGGKSLCYQIPALVLPGTTVVLSPLIALMQDQVDTLRRKGIRATFINSSLDGPERRRRQSALAEGQFDLVYVTPERFRKDAFLEAIAQVEVPLLAVDEAHCISTWGHDFRPEYGRVGRIRERLRRPTTMALTATATPETQTDIRTRLGIEDASLFHSGIDRPNLHIGVREIRDDDERFDRIAELIERIGGPGIVYLTLIKDLHRLEDVLRRRGLDPQVYHGKLSSMERRAMQRRFLESRSGVVLATNAFGMGVDKADIRFILHCQIPGSLEAYYQEVGRSGRDGRPSLCELLYLPDDLMIQKQFIEWSNPDAEFLRSVFDVLMNWGDTLHAREIQDLREMLLLRNRADARADTCVSLLRAEGIVEGDFENSNLKILRPLAPGEEHKLIDSGKRERGLRKLLDMLEYARQTTCRRRSINQYFGFDEGDDCGHCDRCLETEEFLRRADEAAARQIVSDEATKAASEDSTATAESDEASSGDAKEDQAPVKRGEWLLINRRHHVVVKSVEKTRRGFAIEAESANDLKLRRYDLNRVRWERVQ